MLHALASPPCNSNVCCTEMTCEAGGNQASFINGVSFMDGMPISLSHWCYNIFHIACNKEVVAGLGANI